VTALKPTYSSSPAHLSLMLKTTTGCQLRPQQSLSLSRLFLKGLQMRLNTWPSTYNHSYLSANTFMD